MSGNRRLRLRSRGGTDDRLEPVDPRPHIREASLPLKVFWPDLYDPFLGTSRVRRIANRVAGITERFMDEYNLPKPEQYGTDYSMEGFFHDLEREEILHRELPERERRYIHRTLRRIECDFAELANIFSIAFRTHYKRRSKLLFLGDLTDDSLNQLTIPGSKRYECLKAPHHGTTFGRSLRNMLTEFLLISRSQRDFPNIKKINDGYISETRYRMLLSTEFLGDCYIC